MASSSAVRSKETRRRFLVSENKTPLLSICIPTFDRSGLLEEALTALVANISDCKDSDTEIVISNNASTDDTQQLCEKFCQDHPHINWNVVKQPVSVGADNVQLVTTFATGRYIWILSDDDILLPGAVSTILENIKEGYDVLLTNHTSFDANIAVQLPPHFMETQDITFVGPNETIEYLGTMITFLSIICFRAVLVDVHAYGFAFGSNLPQSYMFVDAILSSKSQKLIFSPVLSARRNNTGGYSVFNVFIEKFFVLLEYGKQKGIEFDVVERVKRKHLIRFLLPLVVLMKTGGIGALAPDWSSTKELFRQYYGRNMIYWLLVAPMVYASPKVVYALANIRRLVKGLKR